MIKNQKDFRKFLNANAKRQPFDFAEYVKDAEKQYGNTGSPQYELSQFDSKSGRPELFDLEIEEDEVR